MKFKLLNSKYNADTKLSTATLQTPYGVMVGKARLHPDDTTYESSFFGCQIAEAKAKLRAYKEKIRENKIKIKALQDFEKVLKNLKDYNPHSLECKKLRKQIYLLTKENQEIQTMIQNAHIAMRKAEENRKKTLDIINEKRKRILDK